MKKFTRIALALVFVFSVAFMSVGRAAAQTTGGAGETKVVDIPWFVNLPNGASGGIQNLGTPAFNVLPYPDTAHYLHVLSVASVSATPAGLHLICFLTPASGGAIFWWEPTLSVWVPLANFQSYPNFDDVAYTCVNTWATGTFAFGYIVP
jgi:hypothetical protein